MVDPVLWLVWSDYEDNASSDDTEHVAYRKHVESVYGSTCDVKYYPDGGVGSVEKYRQCHPPSVLS